MSDYSKLTDLLEAENPNNRLSADQSLEINTPAQGLSSEEVVRRFNRDGANLLPEKREKSVL